MGRCGHPGLQVSELAAGAGAEAGAALTSRLAAASELLAEAERESGYSAALRPPEPVPLYGTAGTLGLGETGGEGEGLGETAKRLRAARDLRGRIARRLRNWEDARADARARARLYPPASGVLRVCAAALQLGLDRREGASRLAAEGRAPSDAGFEDEGLAALAAAASDDEGGEEASAPRAHGRLGAAARAACQDAPLPPRGPERALLGRELGAQGSLALLLCAWGVGFRFPGDDRGDAVSSVRAPGGLQAAAGSPVAAGTGFWPVAGR